MQLALAAPVPPPLEDLARGPLFDYTIRTRETRFHRDETQPAQPALALSTHLTEFDWRGLLHVSLAPGATVRDSLVPVAGAFGDAVRAASELYQRERVPLAVLQVAAGSFALLRLTDQPFGQRENQFERWLDRGSILRTSRELDDYLRPHVVDPQQRATLATTLRTAEAMSTKAWYNRLVPTSHLVQALVAFEGPIDLRYGPR